MWFISVKMTFGGAQFRQHNQTFLDLNVVSTDISPELNKFVTLNINPINNVGNHKPINLTINRYNETPELKHNNNIVIVPTNLIEYTDVLNAPKRNKGAGNLGLGNLGAFNKRVSTGKITKQKQKSQNKQFIEIDTLLGDVNRVLTLLKFCYPQLNNVPEDELCDEIDKFLKHIVRFKGTNERERLHMQLITDGPIRI